MHDDLRFARIHSRTHGHKQQFDGLFQRVHKHISAKEMYLPTQKVAIHILWRLKFGPHLVVSSMNGTCLAINKHVSKWEVQ